VINSLLADPELIGSLQDSTITVDAADADGDTLTYEWMANSGSILGSGPVVTYTAPDVPSQATLFVSVTVSDGKGGSDEETVSIVVDPAAVNHDPVINSISCDPDPVTMNNDAALTADVTDIDGDDIEYLWEVSDGDVVATLQGGAIFTAPSVGADTTVTVTLTVNDGNGGSDSDSIEVDVLFVQELLDHIEVNDGDPLPGSGTELDPYLIDGDPGSELEVQFKAVGTLGGDLTSFAAWAENSSAPGTGFTLTTLGLLYVSPFDNTFEVTAVYDSVTSQPIYFQVVPPS
jgi:hypothetical protein